MKKETLISKLKAKLTAKLLFGVGLIILGLWNVLPFSMNETDIVGTFIRVILGTLLLVTGAGLVVLDQSERRKETSEHINVFIGKELFEKGLYGLVIGVVVGSLTLLIEMLKVES